MQCRMVYTKRMPQAAYTQETSISGDFYPVRSSSWVQSSQEQRSGN